MEEKKNLTLVDGNGQEVNKEEESSILTLTDENGQDMNFEYLDCIEYKGKEYLLLMPG